MNTIRFLLTLLCAVCFHAASAAETTRPNVLLICVDDLKPQLGCYGEEVVKSPNIDRLAARGMVFDRAYCNQAVCAPSRNALFAGVRSTTLGIYDLGTNFRKSVPDAVTVMQYFMRHGWRTEGLGKIFHVGHGNHEDPASWSVPHMHEKVVNYTLPQNTTASVITREEAYFSNTRLNEIEKLPRGAAYENAEVPDNAYADGRIADETIRRLRNAKEKPDEPFFLAVGFVKPHLPFCAPKKYWELYDRNTFALPVRRTPPDGAPEYAPQFGGELRQYSGIPKEGDLPDDLQRTLIHGYHAATSYMDAQLGKVLDELDRLKLNDDTIIVLWGDHGWHLGDHSMWCKHTNYEQANRIPFLIIAHGQVKPGTRTAAFAETVDLYPTLCELAGLPKPDVPQPLDGLSLVPVLRDPSASVRDYVQHAYPRGQRLGRAVRNTRYRLVEWKGAAAPADTAELELYDYETDPGETKNLAAEKPEVVADLRKILAAQPEAKPQIEREKPATTSTRTSAAAGKRDAPTSKPNILLITVDDMNCDSIGAFGCKLPGTSPTVDRLAAEGLRFQYAHVQTGACMPSRNAMFSGRYPHNNHVEGFYQVADADYPVLADLMRDGGYFAGIHGKVPHSTPYSPYNWDLVIAGEDGNAERRNAASYRKATLEGIEAAKKVGKPFCLNINVADPHKPFYAEANNGATVPDPNVPSRVFTPEEVPVPGYLADDPVVRKELSHYYSSVRRADDCVAEVLKALKDSRQEDNTVVMFLSDNGMPLPFAKTQLYHHSTWTPWIVRWPGVTRAGAVDNVHMISGVDVLPTFLEIAGIRPPKGIDGRSFLPLLQGKKQEGRDMIFKEHNENSGGHRNPMRAVQTREYLYIFNPWSNGVRVMGTATAGTPTYRRMKELAKTSATIAARMKLLDHRVPEEAYHVPSDPNALKNLIGDPEHKKEIERLRGALEAWMKKTGDPLLEVFQKRDDPTVSEAYTKRQEKESAERRANKQGGRQGRRKAKRAEKESE